MGVCMHPDHLARAPVWPAAWRTAVLSVFRLSIPHERGDFGAARHDTTHDPRRGIRARLRLWVSRRAGAAAAVGRLPGRRHGDGAVHAWLRRRCRARAAARRGRRDPSDVRRRPPLLDPRSPGGPRHRDSRRNRPDPDRDPGRRLARAILGMVAAGRAHVRARALRGEHGRAAARTRAAGQARVGGGAHRGRLADRRGPRDGAGPGPVTRPRADVRRRAGRRGRLWPCRGAAPGSRLG